jgi:hypothetical protein
MRITPSRPLMAIAMLVLAGCGRPKEKDTPPMTPPAADHADSFGADLAFLRSHTDVVVLSSADGAAQIAVAPAYQGRVMTSTADGPGGASFGYLHRAGIGANTPQPHMTVLGGEDRFWLGPEGGQYALYFPPGAAFDADHWQVPRPIDWDTWPIVSQTGQQAAFQRDMTLTNYAGTNFSIRVDRAIRLLDREGVTGLLGTAPGPGTRVVAYESDNRITNTGAAAWTKPTGLVSIWILGMYRPGPKTTVVVPFVPGSIEAKGPMVNDAYFGKIDPDRLRIGDGALFFRGDGKKRGKIGIPRPRARNLAGSFDPDRHVLTIVTFSLPDAGDYVNSMWERQAQPFAGDVVNSYNDGPLTPGGAPLGPFYEVESSSPAAALAPGGSLEHVHRTVHLQGPDAELDAIAKKVLGVTLAEIAAALK